MVHDAKFFSEPSLKMERERERIMVPGTADGAIVQQGTKYIFHAIETGKRQLTLACHARDKKRGDDAERLFLSCFTNLPPRQV